MRIVINGEETTLEEIVTVSGLLSYLGINGKIAIEINQRIVPRSEFRTHPVNDGDIIEIVHAIGGG